MSPACFPRTRSDKKDPAPQVNNNKPEDDQNLYVVLPYFNYCGYESRKRLFLDFVERIKDQKGVRLVIAEARESTKETFDLPRDLEGVFLHVRVATKSRIWIKECLVNVAVRKLPRDWATLAWIDADLTFLNPTWVGDTIERLKSHDVVQLFQNCVNLGPVGEIGKIDTSFMYMHEKSGKPYHKAAKYGFWHPGYAWACSRKAFEQMGGLVDWAILGSGDRHMALALIGLVQYSHPGNIHGEYSQMLRAFQERCKGLRSTYVPGTIVHHFHGNLADRKYQERWTLLTRSGDEYDPSEDIARTAHGVVQLTTKGLRLQDRFSDYFLGRNEDFKIA
jgi:hypothetical protein